MFCYFSVRCRTALKENAKRCFIVSGAFTLLAENSSLPLNWTVPHALASTKQVMNNGLLKMVHPDVIDVSFIDDSEDDLSSGNNLDVLPTPEPDNMESRAITDEETRKAWPWVLLVIGLLVLLTLAIFAVRRRRREVEVPRRKAATPTGSSPAKTSSRKV